MNSVLVAPAALARAEEDTAGDAELDADELDDGGDGGEFLATV
ncbi:MAG: hypothetical protein WAN72_18745 [Candidatus Acidiferrales bacterium]